MRAFRRLGTVAVTAAMTLGASTFVGVTPAHAEDLVTAVGGGAAGLRLVGGQASFSFSGGVFVDDEIATPEVTLPYEGSGGQVITDQLVDETVAGVTATVAKVTTTGAKSGDPFAHSTSTLTNVQVGTTTVAYVQTECNWDTNGATGSTTIVGLGADQSPAPNTPHEIPGVGIVTLNKQVASEWEGRRVLTVVGIDITLTDAPAGAVTYNPPFELQIGFSSCDPSDPPTREQTLQAQLLNLASHVGYFLPGG